MDAISSSSSQTDINVLPEETLLHVFSFLKPQELCAIAPVCKLWNRVSSDDSIWRKICKEELPENYLKLPEILLKDKFLLHGKEEKERIDYVLSNSEAKVYMGPEYYEDSAGVAHEKQVYDRIFSEKLIDLLKDPKRNRKEKIDVLGKEVNEALPSNCDYLNQSRFVRICDLYPRMKAKRKNEEGYEAIEIFLKAGVNPNQKVYKINEQQYFTPLMTAAYCTDEALIKLLLEYNADLNVKNDNDESALDVAIMAEFTERKNNAKVIQLLLDRGIDPQVAPKTEKVILQRFTTIEAYFEDIKKRANE